MMEILSQRDMRIKSILFELSLEEISGFMPEKDNAYWKSQQMAFADA